MGFKYQLMLHILCFSMILKLILALLFLDFIVLLSLLLQVFIDCFYCSINFSYFILFVSIVLLFKSYYCKLP